ncbi:hypothetical protein Pmani_023695 [Petrolisthes manimaculis]|uniref:Uncharacterized protein n=1 Tax=Petrolisthes manimaculis TaxID=1843537 RepID=A0AAE1PBH6_9EUCA|nr:hypothetical protein Pmani_023695 [Petrolisthes manimaculis]
MRFTSIYISVLVCTMVGATLSTLGNLYIVTPQRIETDPQAPYRNQRDYLNKHGPSGVLLIDSLGNGSYRHVANTVPSSSRRYDIGPPLPYYHIQYPR